MRWWLAVLLLGCSHGGPAIRALDRTHGLACDRPLLVVHDAEAWEAFLAQQPAEPALRLRQLEIDFARQTFVLARYTAASGSTLVRFAPRMDGDGVLRIEVRATTPSGNVRADVTVHRFAAVVEAPNVRAELVEFRRP